MIIFIGKHHIAVALCTGYAALHYINPTVQAQMLIAVLLILLAIGVDTFTKNSLYTILTIGVIMTVIVFTHLNILRDCYVYMLALVVGALLPDIDHSKSLINKYLGPVGRWIGKHTQHRGFTHSLCFVACVTILTFPLLTPLLTLGLFTGMLSHVLSDMCTNSGVALLAPITDYRFKIANFKTGTPAESYLAIGFCIFMLYAAHTEQLIQLIQ